MNSFKTSYEIIAENENLKAEIKRYKNFILDLTEGILELDTEGNTVYANSSFEKILSYNTNEALGVNFKNYIYEEDLAQAISKFSERLQGKTDTHEIRLKNKHGDIVWARISTRPLFENGIVTGVCAVISDITSYKNQELVIVESQKRYCTLYENTPAMLHSIDTKGRILSVSDFWLEKLGYTREEVVGRPSTDFLTEESKIYATNEVLPIFFQCGFIKNIRYDMVTKDGKILNVLLSATAEYDSKKSITRTLAVIEDITEKKRDEEALRLASKYNRILIEASLDPFVMISPDGRISDLNKATEEATGYSRTELIGTDFSTYFTEPCKAKKVYEKVFREGTVRNYELELQNRNATKISVIYNASVCKDENGEVKGVFAAARDITPQKNAKEALRESQKRYFRMISSVTNYIYTVKIENGKVISTHHGEGCLAVTGYSSVDYNNDKDLWFKMIYEEDREYVLAQAQLALVGLNPPTLEHRIVHKNNSIRWISNTIVIRSKDKTNTFYDGMISDITERKKIEDELRQAKILADNANKAKSDFLANMSHEIRTPMNAMLGFTNLAIKRELGSEQRDFLECVLEAGSSLNQIINDILDFSKIEAGRISIVNEPFDLRLFAEKICKLFTSVVQKKKLELSLAIDDRIPRFLDGDQGRLRQVLVNLLGNALKFTHEGSVSVSFGVESGDNFPNNVGGNRFKLLCSVQDTGIGIPPEKTGIIFDSFTQADSTTTKQFGGTGLGLTISKKLVNMMGGEMWVETVLNEGSTFYFTILTQGSKKMKPLAPEVDQCAQTPGTHLNILLAEDDRLNQIFTEAMLKEAGHSVGIASTGLQVLVSGPEVFDPHGSNRAGGI